MNLNELTAMKNTPAAAGAIKKLRLMGRKGSEVEMKEKDYKSPIFNEKMRMDDEKRTFSIHKLNNNHNI